MHANIINNAQKLCQPPQALSLFKTKLVKLTRYPKCANIQLSIGDLESKLFSQPVVTCVKGSDGKVDHTITIFQGYIFDGNFTHALPFSKEALDYYCLSDSDKCKFVQFLNSFYLPYFDAYMKEFEQLFEKKKKN